MILKNSFKDAKRIALKAKDKYRGRPEVQVEIISRLKAFPPPEDYRRVGKRRWCPYCGKVRLFKLDRVWNSRRCPVCGISEADFYVRHYNKLWELEIDKMVREQERKRRRKKEDI